MQTISKDMQAELDRLASEGGGLLLPSAVVQSAEAEDSPLHGWFQWDDDKAAHGYRLWQARELIRVSVTIVERPVGKPIEVRAFVSLRSDRTTGGYRRTVDVIRDAEQFDEMLADALAELKQLRAKYSSLKQLAPVFSALDGVLKAS